MNPQNQIVPITQVRPSLNNPRQNLQEGIRELVVSINTSGILNPLLVRRDGDRYDLIAGHRRLTAALMIGLKDVPVRILDASEDEAQELRIIDNAQRVDIHPLEEAEAYAHLALRIRGQTLGKLPGAEDEVGQISRKVGKSRAHVAGRIVLVRLPEIAKHAYRERQIDGEVALLIARTEDPKAREAAAKFACTPERNHWKGNVPVYPNAAEVRHYLRKEAMQKLSGAPFDRKDAELVPAAGACISCPKRSGNDRDLFGDVREEDLCTDTGCFRKKLDAHFVRLASKHEGEVLAKSRGKQLFSSHDRGTLTHDSGFIDPNKEEWTGSGNTSLRKLLGEHAPEAVTLVQDPNGYPRQLWKKADYEAARKEVDKAAKAGKSDDSAAKYRQSQIDSQKKAKLRKAARYVALDKVVAATMLQPEDQKHEALFLRTLISAIVEDGFYPDEQIEALYPELKKMKPKEYAAWFEKAPVKVLRTIALIETVGNIKTNWKAERAVDGIVQYLKLDWKQLEGEARSKAEEAKLLAKQAEKAKGEKK